MTARARFRAGCKTIIDTVKTANPTLIAHTYDHRPGSFRTPCAFVENSITTPLVNLDSGTWQRDLQGEIHIVNKLVSNEQAAHEQDVLSDLMDQAVVDNPNASSMTGGRIVIRYASVDSHEETDGQATYACTVLTIRGLILLGR